MRHIGIGSASSKSMILADQKYDFDQEYDFQDTRLTCGGVQCFATL
jgi:hypothetical protein